MRRILTGILLAIGIIGGVSAADKPVPGVTWNPPAGGLVPDAETAVKVALAVLPHLGPDARREIQEYRPWHAERVANAWQVRGTLLRESVGGTLVVVVAVSDARIIGIFHEQ